MPRLEEIANVALRVPSILMLDLLYKCDIDSITEQLRSKNEDMMFKYKYVMWNIYYLGHLFSVVVLVLPLRHIVKLYLHILAVLLLYVGHQISRDYVQGEIQHGYERAVYLDSLAFNRFVTALTSQIILSTLCAFLMKTRQVWLFSAHLLPLVARLFAVPHTMLLTVNTFSMVLTAVEVAAFLLSNLFVPYKLARSAYREVLQIEMTELYRFLAVGISLWNQFAVPTLLSVFWFILFVVQIYSSATARNNFLSQQGVLYVFLTSVSKCCSTPYSLLGLTFIVSYLALGLLNLCKFYLGGYAAVHNENVMHRGVTEGVTLLLLALQTGLLDMQVLQRTFLLSIILFIVVTSMLQSMVEITDPIILALGASRNRSVLKHFRGVSMCLFLLVFPGFMAYKISQFFHMDFWLLILVSSCMLTSLQVMGTLLIYMLFMIELVRSHPIESLDEIIYYVNAVSRVLEFLVALCVVCYGTWESLFGEWSWMGASVIIIHSYFNVWLRAQSGWKSFLLRQEAAKKIHSLPRATAQQLERHSDVCAICFQEMDSAVVTYCSHFFHANCLRKWLYVQETCPMCHQQVKPSVRQQNGSAQEGQAPAAHREEGRRVFQAGETGTQDSGFRPAHGADVRNEPDDSEDDQGNSLSEGGEGESDDNITCEGDSLDGEEQTLASGLCCSGNVVGNIDPVIQNNTLVDTSPLTAEESAMNIMESETDQQKEENFRYTSSQGVVDILTDQRSTVGHVMAEAVVCGGDAETLSPGLTFQPTGRSGDFTDTQNIQGELSHHVKVRVNDKSCSLSHLLGSNEESLVGDYHSESVDNGLLLETLGNGLSPLLSHSGMLLNTVTAEDAVLAGEMDDQESFRNHAYSPSPQGQEHSVSTVTQVGDFNEDGADLENIRVQENHFS
ncbi:RING finger protein 145-like [Acipenser ruthenus]|uniref:RING finger protein 145-like n=1 Tax=Acipenser ruthenus TaxID=7906 RepID=UPI0027429377|nr:RING finger protein 145-like [Acipenser ruthenus]